MPYARRSPLSTPSPSPVDRSTGLSVALSWLDIPQGVIQQLIALYAATGDSILFGTSKDKQVLAIRVYRDGQSYAVYVKDLQLLGDALERLFIICPPLEPPSKVRSVSPPATASLPSAPTYTSLWDWQQKAPAHDLYNPPSEEEKKTCSPYRVMYHDNLTKKR